MSEIVLTDQQQPQSHLEDVLGKYGYRLFWQWTADECRMAAFEIVGRNKLTREAMFARDPQAALLVSNDLPPHTEDIAQARPFLSARLIPNGCTDIECDGHLCGPKHYIKVMLLLRHVYEFGMHLLGQQSTWEADSPAAIASALAKAKPTR